MLRIGCYILMFVMILWWRNESTKQVDFIKITEISLAR